MLEKIQRQNRLVEDQVRGQLEGAGVETTLDDEDMGVSIGNETHYHYQAGADRQGIPPAATERGKRVNPWVAAALGGLLGAGGGGMAAALMSGDEKPVPTVARDTDTDTVTDVTPGFGTPQYVEE